LKETLGPKKFLKKFLVFELIVIAICAAIGVAVKPVMVILVQIITGPLFIPGGTIVGGFYMMWLVVSAGLVGKRGAATLTAIVQALLVIATGVVGTHGIMTLATYIIPGIAIDIMLLITGQKARNNFSCFFAGMAANSTGAFLTNFVFFRLPAIPLVLVVAGGALSGGLGGMIAYGLIKGFMKIKIPGLNLNSSEEKR
jgi:ABC-type thiamin/hydroxymethylpyrimidine transport system permease subunit